MIALPQTLSYAAYLECARCKKEYSLAELQNFAVCCHQPLVVKYDYMPGFF